MNTYLEEFPNLKTVLRSFSGREQHYNWLLTDAEFHDFDRCLKYFESEVTFDDGSIAYWITGENLYKLAFEQEPYFVWGVFSAFDKNENIDLETLKPIPYADGHSSYWNGDPRIQHPKAIAELVFWDSEFILLLSRNQEWSKSFRNSFGGWKDLNEHEQEDM
ncbi:hypothetical protein ACFQPF_08305 [Fictibacillus iocasae]|uniref:DUF2691 domain-containing protein n=1 Tax=Fictibacillus iocasae TaxID=2715437 RepID=A0ABW2NMM1_9BACL